MARELRGILSAMCTPFGAGGAIDEGALGELTEGTIRAGVHGLIPCGSTGEFAALTTDERTRVADVVVQRAAGRVPVVPHVGSTSTATAVELARHAERAGADGIMAVNPYYEPLALDEVYAYFRALSDAVDLPIIIYNLPSGTGTNLTPEFLARLGREITRVKYVKDSSGDLSQVSTLLYRYRSDITTFNGWDTITYAGLAIGTKGAVWGAANVMPGQCAELYNLAEAGRLLEARALWEKMWPVMQFFVTEGYVASVKAGARLVGFRVGDPRPPVRPLPAEKIEGLRRLLADAGALREASRVHG